MPPKKKAKKEKAHDFMPDFMKNLNEVIELYEKEGSFRATSLTNAAKSLHGHIITSVDDIETYKLINLRGVDSSTIEMLKEFIQFGKIKRLEEMKEKAHNFIPDFLKNLNELIELYEKEGDFQATSLTNAAKSLHGHIITSVDDIETNKLLKLQGVGSSTIEMLQEFIQLGKIKSLEEKKLKAHDFIPDFMKNLNELIELYEKEVKLIHQRIIHSNHKLKLSNLKYLKEQTELIKHEIEKQTIELVERFRE